MALFVVLATVDINDETWQPTRNYSEPRQSPAQPYERRDTRGHSWNR